MDLIAHCGLAAYNPCVPARSFRQRLGDRLLILREQERKWSRRRAGTETGVNDGTIKAMEQGENAGWDFFERYAIALGTTLEVVCREVLMLDEGDGRALDADEQALVETLTSLKKLPDERALFLQTAKMFRVLGQKQTAADTAAPRESAQSITQRATGSQGPAHAGSARSRKSRSGN